MKFSLVHASRGRPDQAGGIVSEWRLAGSGEHEIEHLLSIDDDDPARDAYAAVARELPLTLITGPNRTLVQAANRAAERAQGDVLIVVSDDFGCPLRWDAELASIFSERRDLAVLVDDGLGARIMTLPILGRDLYRRLGYAYHPAYHGQFVDEDLTETARALGVLVEAKHLLFPHRHFSAGRAKLDATYMRHNQPGSWWSGWMTFEQRKLFGFGVIRPAEDAARRSSRIGFYTRARLAGSAVRRLWLKRLPASLVDTEQRFRNATLRSIERLLGINAPV
ncbi:MAG: hypothetical protein K1Y01_11345 [Vicinamibacteria bacterium]|nr:hypothetical protein [Vicinamibacteria bacterium]